MKLKAEAGVAGIALMGVEYVNDSEGCVVVPDDLVAVALANGYATPSLAPPSRGRAAPAIDPSAPE